MDWTCDSTLKTEDSRRRSLRMNLRPSRPELQSCRVDGFQFSIILYRFSLSIHERFKGISRVSHCQVCPALPVLNLYWALQVVPAWGRCFPKVQRLDHSNAGQQLCSCWMWCHLPLLHPRPFRERPERYCSNHHAERHQQFVGSNLCSQIFGSLFVSERHHFVRLCFWCFELCTFEFRFEFLLSLHHGSDFWPRCDFRSSDSSTVYELRSTWRDGKSPRSCEFCCDDYSWTWSKDFSPSVSCMSDIQSSFNLERFLEWIRVKLLVVACGCLWEKSCLV